MSRIRKTFVADGEQEGGGIKASSVKNSLLEIVLKLAAVNGYNDEKNIRGPNGNYMTGTDVAALAAYALQPERIVRGKSEFIQLCMQAGVPAGLIVNENMKAYLPTTAAETTAQPRAPSPAPSIATHAVTPADPPAPRVINNPPADLPKPPPLQGPFPELPPKRRGRPRKQPPTLQGPFPHVSAHDVPLPNVSLGTKRGSESVDESRPAKRPYSYRTIADISDDETDYHKDRLQ